MLWLGLFASLVSVPGVTGAFIPTTWAGLSIVLSFTIWRRANVGPLHWIGLGFLGYATLSLAWAPSIDDGIWRLWQLFVLTLAFYLGSTLPTLRRLWIGLGLGLTVSSVIAVAQWYEARYVLCSEGAACLSNSLLHLNNTPSGLFYSSIAFGATALLVFLGCIVHRLWWLALGVAPGLWLAQSRAAFLALGAVASLLIPSRFRPAAMLLVTIAVLGLLYRPASDEFRLLVWQTVLNNLTLFGHGPGSFTNVYISFQGTFHRPGFAHSEPLDLLHEFGLGAIAVFYIATFLLIKTRSAREWPVFLAFIILSLLSSTFSFPLAAFAGACVAGKLAHDWHRTWASSSLGRPDVVSRDMLGLPDRLAPVPVQLGTPCPSNPSPDPRCGMSTPTMMPAMASFKH